MLADYAAHPDGALTWRYQNQWSGSGVAGDLVSHGIDLARYVVGEISELLADTAIFIPQRPALSRGGHRSQLPRVAASRGRSRTRTSSPPCSASAAALAGSWSRAVRRSASSARTASRCTAIAARWPGTSGGWASCSCASDQDYTNAAYVTEFVGPGAGEFAAYQPAGGIAMSYDDLKVVEAHRLAASIVSGVPRGADRRRGDRRRARRRDAGVRPRVPLGARRLPVTA